jgi:hypothetical protein
MASTGTTLAAAMMAMLTLAAWQGRAAHAQAAALDDDDDDDATAPVAPVEAEASEDPNKPHVGVGIRLRYVTLPKGLIELFVEHAAAGAAHPGFGVEVQRRKGNFEVQFGVEYESLNIKDGVWIDKGDSIPMDEPDYVEFDGFGWVGADVNFIYHTPIIDQLSLRYGAGLGLGVMLGHIYRTDYVCTTDNIDSCNEKVGGENKHAEEDGVPPVFPMINFLLGVQIKPVDHVFVNIEGGIRTIPFFGTTAGYVF